MLEAKCNRWTRSANSDFKSALEAFLAVKGIETLKNLSDSSLSKDFLFASFTELFKSMSEWFAFAFNSKLFSPQADLQEEEFQQRAENDNKWQSIYLVASVANLNNEAGEESEEGEARKYYDYNEL